VSRTLTIPSLGDLTWKGAGYAFLVCWLLLGTFTDGRQNARLSKLEAKAPAIVVPKPDTTPAPLPTPIPTPLPRPAPTDPVSIAASNYRKTEGASFRALKEQIRAGKLTRTGDLAKDRAAFAAAILALREPYSDPLGDRFCESSDWLASCDLAADALDGGGP
jgi:hypothetical protein